MRVALVNVFFFSPLALINSGTEIKNMDKLLQYFSNGNYGQQIYYRDLKAVAFAVNSSF